MKKRIICMLMVCCILCYSNIIKINASEADVRVYTRDNVNSIQGNDTMPYISLDSVQPRMIITISVVPGLSVKGNMATCSTVVLGVPDKVERIKIIMHLQRADSYDNYYDIVKWETTREGNINDIEKTYPLSSRGIYRVQADTYVYDNDNNCELNFFYSYEKSY